MVSPLLANVYLHYVFDLWVEAWRKKVARGDVIVVRYADDLVVGFEHRAEAERFLEEFRERLAKFGLELHADKTRLIEFGRFAEQNRGQRGEGKPETFTFLGFTHYCGTTATGRFIVWRKTAGKRMVAKLQYHKAAAPPPDARAACDSRANGCGSVVRGYYQYHAVPGNTRISLAGSDTGSAGCGGIFLYAAASAKVAWDRYRRCSTAGFLSRVLASLSQRSLRRHASKVGAVCVDAHVRICAGGDQRWSSLPRPETSLPQWDPFPHVRVFPLKGFGSFLIEADIAEDLAFEIGDRSEDAPIDDVALELTEPALDLVEP